MGRILGIAKVQGLKARIECLLTELQADSFWRGRVSCAGTAIGFINNSKLGHQSTLRTLGKLLSRIQTAPKANWSWIF